MYDLQAKLLKILLQIHWYSFMVDNIRAKDCQQNILNPLFDILNRLFQMSFIANQIPRFQTDDPISLFLLFL